MATDKHVHAPAAGATAAEKAQAGSQAGTDLWTRIVAIGKARDISYREATEIAVKEYWLEHKLDKKP